MNKKCRTVKGVNYFSFCSNVWCLSVNHITAEADTDLAHITNHCKTCNDDFIITSLLD